MYPESRSLLAIGYAKEEKVMAIGMNALRIIVLTILLPTCRYQSCESSEKKLALINRMMTPVLRKVATKTPTVIR